MDLHDQKKLLFQEGIAHKAGSFNAMAVRHKKIYRRQKACSTGIPTSYTAFLDSLH